jgi:serine/threonine protein kinase/tetratricopeptide (TPR) repeat protein
MLKPGQRLGPYEVVSFLARGGMGEIYVARDHRLERDVAIKIIRENEIDSMDSLPRLEREAKALAALSHPNILSIYDVGTDSGISYVVMELLHGESLRSRRNRGPLSWNEIRDITIAVADALNAAHSKGIIHRDIKPENIFITSEGRTKILDFGLARLRPQILIETDSSGKTPAKWTTETGTLIGTILYMSPEQICGKPVDPRSDIFSAGVLFYEIATGVHPFHDTNLNGVISKILNATPKPVEELNHHYPPAFQQVILRSLEKDPGERYQSSLEMLNDLRTIPETSTQRAKMKGSHKILYLAILGLAVLLGVLIFGVFMNRPTPATIHSIAIIPFLNRTSDPGTEYLIDGMTNGIIGHISRIETLKVMASGTVFTYKGKQIDPRKIGRELNVDAVASGSIAQEGETLIIQAELVNVADGSVIWTDEYRRRMSDVQLIQSELSNKIAENLQLELTGQQQKRVSEQMTDDPEAYELYLRGRYLWKTFSPDNLLKSIEYFKKAVQKDPEYALAWAGLSDAYGAMATNGWLPPAEAFPMSKEAALKAIVLDPDLAEGQHALGAALFFYERDWKGAEKQFQKALQLNPNLADAYCLYSYLLSSQGRVQEAVAKARKAVELDPLNLKSLNDLAFAYYSSRDFDKAAVQLNKVLEMDHNSEPALNCLVYVHSGKGQHDLAIETALRAVEISKESPIELATLGYAYGTAGREKEARDILLKLNDKAQVSYVSDFYFGHVYSALGDKDQAFFWLFKACNNWMGDWGMLFISSSPYSDSLRKDPRFVELLRCMKF